MSKFYFQSIYIFKILYYISINKQASVGITLNLMCGNSKKKRRKKKEKVERKVNKIEAGM